MVECTLCAICAFIILYMVLKLDLWHIKGWGQSYGADAWRAPEKPHGGHCQFLMLWHTSWKLFSMQTFCLPWSQESSIRPEIYQGMFYINTLTHGKILENIFGFELKTASEDGRSCFWCAWLKIKAHFDWFDTPSITVHHYLWVWIFPL